MAVTMEQIKKGMKFVWHHPKFLTRGYGFDVDFRNGDIGEIISVNEGYEGYGLIKNTRNNKTQNWTFDIDLAHMTIYEDKPHEYSPVNLTMYYRTIGD